MALLPEGKTHQDGNSKGTCTQRSVSHRSIDHRSTSHRPFAQWTRRHFRTTGHGSPATSQMGITQEFSSQSITCHQPSSRWSLDLENINTGEINIHQSTDHRSQVIRIYINLHLAKLMPWAWSSLIIIITQKSFITRGTGLQ